MSDMKPPRIALAAAWRFCFVALAGAACTAAAAPVGRQIESHQADLKALKSRIQSLNKEIAVGEAAKADLAGELAASERAIAAISRRLREIASERAAAESELATLETESAALDKRIAARQAKLADLLRRQYMNGPQEGVGHLLASEDQAEVARRSYYLGLIGQARARDLADLRADLDRHKELATQAEARRARFASLETERASEQAKLEVERRRRAESLAKLGEKLKASKHEVSVLEQDGQRLSRLIDNLARIQEQKRKEAKAREEAAARAAAARQKKLQARSAGGRSVGTPERQAAGEPRRMRDDAPPAPMRVESVSGPTPTGITFSQLRGRLLLPVRGELTGRFGAPRSDGGTAWKGVFIRAASGAEVKAVAAGRVAYAEWLRGFGNLIIVDHDDGYLTIYANNDSLLKAAGQPVAGGETIARVGASGGNMETGLYFEIRHLGQPLDPMKWVKLK
ncbi:MAG: peptidoglycan DD-metalloendopeptidase family protein [Zoogloea sp.]|nr:peptidoglycan DD-metalloendopeptidase family protein [Zoogloea sp.]